jgi:hypothetical protein
MKRSTGPLIGKLLTRDELPDCLKQFKGEVLSQYAAIWYAARTRWPDRDFDSIQDIIFQLQGYMRVEHGASFCDVSHLSIDEICDQLRLDGEPPDDDSRRKHGMGKEKPGKRGPTCEREFTTSGEYFAFLFRFEKMKDAQIRDKWMGMNDGERKKICAEDWTQLATSVRTAKSRNISRAALTNIVKRRRLTAERKRKLTESKSAQKS